jgi:transposase
MKIIGCDLHARQQTIAMLDTDTGEFVEKTLEHDGEELRKFYSGLSHPVLVGIEATGSMQWFLEMMEELGIECRVGHPAKIRKAETRKQKHDRRDARLLLTLLAENRFPTIWMPSTEQRDLRTLLRHRHQWVRLRASHHVSQGEIGSDNPCSRHLSESQCPVRALIRHVECFRIRHDLG